MQSSPFWPCGVQNQSTEQSKWANHLVWLPLQAKDELNETDEKRVSAVKELRGMIKEKADAGDDLAKGVQNTFGEKPDTLLVRFIRARKYDVPRAFELMKGKFKKMLKTFIQSDFQ